MRERKEETVDKRALTAPVPATQLCQFCGKRPAPERHFVTVPVPEAFTRVCDKDLVPIKEEIRKRVRPIIAEVFAEAKAKNLKKTLSQK